MASDVAKKQTEIPGIPQSKLGKLAEQFCAQKDVMAHEKEKLSKIGDEIADQMAEDKRVSFTVTYEGEKYRFAVVEGKERLVCTKSQITDNGN